MWILVNDDTPAEVLKKRLDDKIAASRFTASTSLGRVGSSRHGVKIENVRLRRRKDYCGAHPGPCLVQGRKHKVATYLEGLDWVGFNAMINDLLDAAGTDADVFSYNREATAYSGRYFIRRGKRRRTSYPYNTHISGRFAHWTQTKKDLDARFYDYCGKDSPSLEDVLDDLDGTPGYACYTLEEEDSLRAEEAVAV